MKLPFTIDQFLQMFEKYNLAVWPMQLVLNLLALLAIAAVIRKQKYSDRLISAILAFLWLWSGIVYHWMHFAEINRAAYGFGTLFMIQGLLFVISGVVRPKLSYRYRTDLCGMSGSLFISYALVVYPIMGYFLGPQYPQTPTFGLPCPMTIFTFGFLLWTEKIIPKYVLIIPILWSIIGFGAALSLGMVEDFGLLISGLVGFVLIVYRDRKK